MLQIREILRQKLALKRSHRDVARSLAISPSSVAKVVIDAAALGCDLATLETLTDSELEAKLYPRQRRRAGARRRTAPRSISSFGARA